jgi:diaminopimelate decarboxylase
MQRHDGFISTLGNLADWRRRWTRASSIRCARREKECPGRWCWPDRDSADILYEKAGYTLPLDLECGDRIEILNTGAYTSSYVSVAFNGIPPLKT